MKIKDLRWIKGIKIGYHGLRVQSLKVLFLFLIVTVSFSIKASYAYHPLITDDTGTQGKGRFQYEFQIEYAMDKEEIKRVDLLVNNTLTYGITDSIDLAIGIPYLYWKEENHESIDESGFSDIELGIKYRFYEEDGLKIAIKPSITLPNGDEERGLGAGRTGGRLFLLIDREFKDISLFFNAGYIRNENKVDEREDLWHLSIAGEYRISESLKIVANTGIERNPEVGANKHPIFLIAGGVYSPQESLDLSFGVKAGLTEVETDLSLMAGITVRF